MSSNQTVTAVVFDMGDIFFDATLWRRSIAKHLRDAGLDVDYPTLCRVWEAKLVDVYVGRREYWDVFRELLGELGLEGDGIERTIAFGKQRATEIENRTLFDGVAQTLARLKERGLKLAVLSDTESPEARVRQRLAELDIERHFDAVVTSIDIGHAKPDPEAFAAVLDRLGVAAEETVFVGHDQDELTGASRHGLTTVAYKGDPGVTADHTIECFSELLERVA